MTAAETPSRLGPRPLPLHLAMAYATWTSSYAGLTLWKGGLPNWNPKASGRNEPAAAELEQLLQEINSHDPDDFSQSLAQEVRNRLSALMAGIEAYRAHPYRRNLADPPSRWEEGSARLLDYGAISAESGRHGDVARSDTARSGRAILIVPSLINRSYILDLSKQRSLMRWLAGQGFKPYLIDWGAPDEDEQKFSLTDYVAGYLERALDCVLAETGGQPPVLMGYCMGGLLALALAQRRERDIAGLALLATPWDFHAGESGLATAQLSLVISSYLPLAAQLGCLPVDALQSLFALQDPFAVTRKFVNFSKLGPQSAAAADFVAVEDWINDGVPLAAPVARNCLDGWYLQNEPAKNSWKIAGKDVVPEDLALPCLAVVPAQDKIVPPESAMALCTALKSVEILRPRSGHIGMVVGQQASEDLWRPLARWLFNLSPAAKS